LGLTVDIGNATIQGEDEETVTASQLVAGQFARLRLDSNQPPLTANTVYVHPLEVKVQAPVDAVDCSATPPTISMLGLTVDISKAGFNKRECGRTPACADFTPGQVLKVKLAGETPDSSTNLLTATSIDEMWERGFKCNPPDVKLTAPLKTVNSGGTNVTVLGLAIDISHATLITDNDQLIPAAQLVPGQFVELLLASNQPPLTAKLLEAQTFTSQVNVLVVDQKGNPINDGTLKDVQAVVTVKSKKKVVTFRTVSNGSFSLSGLPAGQAKIAVTRVNNGRKSKASSTVAVNPKSTQHVRIVLKVARK
jgi:hypothetical protein